ncbi:MAG TPA: mandelate racemase/muconate lactonizing enzyme family protein [Myxococcaceae bacterium]|nr:mandelate racemase/muconate lactonizing enzyme family protein [Myxococcaceae bacterium]
MTTELLIRPRTLRFRAPLHTGAGMRAGVEGFWLRLGDGLGEVTLLPGFGTEPIERAKTALGEATSALRGAAPPGSPDEVAARIRAISSLQEAPATRAGVELALLDAGARHAGVPLASWLGAEPRSVRVNALLTDDEVDALVSEARARAHETWDTLKIKVGVQPAAHDATRLTAVREAVGPNVRIRVDGNGAWSEPEARARLQAFAPARLEYVEQPVPASEFESLRKLRSLARIAADESLGIPGAREGLFGGRRPAVDVLVFKLPVVGGILRARRYAALAWQVGVEVVVTSALDGAVSRAGAAHLACTLPLEGPAHGLATGHLLESDMGGYAVSHGMLFLPAGPGLALDPEALGW